MPAANGVKRSVTLSCPEFRDTQRTQEQFTLTHSCCTCRNEALQACTFSITCAQLMAMCLQSNFYTTICTRFSSAYSLDLKILSGHVKQQNQEESHTAEEWLCLSNVVVSAKTSDVVSLSPYIFWMWLCH